MKSPKTMKYNLPYTKKYRKNKYRNNEKSTSDAINKCLNFYGYCLIIGNWMRNQNLSFKEEHKLETNNSLYTRFMQRGNNCFLIKSNLHNCECNSSLF